MHVYVLLIADDAFQMDYNLKKSGIRVLTMCPGVTVTELITEAHTLTPPEDGAQVRNELDSLPNQK